MRFVIFTHSLVSDWNHGNAHFLRGVASELIERGNQVSIFEPEGGWSRRNLLAEQGIERIDEFHRYYPRLRSTLYNENTLDLNGALRNVDVVLVHEWNTPLIVSKIGQHRSTRDYRLFFHDTHHRILTDRAAILAYDLSSYDGVLAYGNVIRDAYIEQGLTSDAWTWHEAADTRVFHPLPSNQRSGDLVWIGNWGDNERSNTLREFLIEPVKALGLKARVYGVRYPPEALTALEEAAIEYGGWLPNYEVPEVFSRYSVTVHIPRGPYVDVLSGIPTIRPFEALACGIPLVSAPWRDSENLFRRGEDFLFADDGLQMMRHLTAILSNQPLADRLKASGLETIVQHHTCAHRVSELLQIANEPALVTAERCVN